MSIACPFPHYMSSIPRVHDAAHGRGTELTVYTLDLKKLNAAKVSYPTPLKRAAVNHGNLAYA